MDGLYERTLSCELLSSLLSLTYCEQHVMLRNYQYIWVKKKRGELWDLYFSYLQF